MHGQPHINNIQDKFAVVSLHFLRKNSETGWNQTLNFSVKDSKLCSNCCNKSFCRGNTAILFHVFNLQSLCLRRKTVGFTVLFHIGIVSEFTTKCFKNGLWNSLYLPARLPGFLSVCVHLCTVYIYIYIYIYNDSIICKNFFFELKKVQINKMYQLD